MTLTHPLAPAAGCVVVALALPFSSPAAAVAAWIMLGVAAGYSISGSP